MIFPFHCNRDDGQVCASHEVIDIAMVTTKNNNKTDKKLPLLELIETDSVRESFTANTDTFQDTITSQLMEH